MQLKSIKTKVILVTSALILITVISITIYSINNSKQNNKQLAENQLNLLVKNEANILKSRIDKNFEILRTIRNIYMHQFKTNTFNRERAIEYMRQNLLAHKDIIAIFSMTMPNGLDQQDEIYKNNEWYGNTGRFVPYIFKDDNSTNIVPLELEPMAEIIDTHIKLKKEIFMDPYFYQVGDEQVLMVTALVPYIHNNEFLGEIGMDFPIDYMQDEAFELKNQIYDGSSNVAIISAENIFAANTSNEILLGQHIDSLNNQELINWIKQDNKTKLWYYNDSLRIKHSVEFGKSKTPWQIYIAVPESVVFNNSKVERNTLILFGIIVLIITILITYIIVHQLIKPLLYLSRKAEIISKGDLTEDIDIKRNDEIGILAESFKIMIDKLKEIIQAVQTNTEEISKGSTQIADSSNIIAQGANEQAASSEEVSSSIEEMAATINQNTDNSNTTAGMAKKVETNISQGRTATVRTAETMQLISEKVKIINEIAERTDILAINAAIEAARAGESGKGFAVVANEVRKLAENSQIAASEISDLMNEGVNIAEKAGTILENALPDVQKTSKLIEEINASSKEQTTNAAQINNAIQQLNSVVMNNTATAEQLASSSEELASQSASLVEIIKFFYLEKKNEEKAEITEEYVAKLEKSLQELLDKKK